MALSGPLSGHGICVFSPGLRLTVTVEAGAHGDEIHLHPGGQGYWAARSIERLGEPITLCATLGGEAGDVLAPLLRCQTGIDLVAITHAASSPITMYDRRSGTRALLARAEAGTIDRHTVDKLYSLALAHSIERGCCMLAGNRDTGLIPTSYYGRLCSDLTAVGVPIIADVHGPELSEVLQHPVRLIKVSEDDLRGDGAIGEDSDEALALAVDGLAARVPHDLVVTRGGDHPAVARVSSRWYRVTPPRLAAVDFRGAGDAMAGAMAVALSRGLPGLETLRFGAAAGAASVTRRGLASLDVELVDALLPRVEIDETSDALEAVRPGH